MTKRMLIDATHPEETRVVVVDGNRLDDFDFETASKKQLKGNIYLARVTRVEPSLQAAFVEYGGNRHGFLAFSEIHPDYYRIPIEDREALLREEQNRALEEDDDDDVPADDDDQPEEIDPVDAGDDALDGDADASDVEQADADPLEDGAAEAVAAGADDGPEQEASDTDPVEPLQEDAVSAEEASAEQAPDETESAESVDAEAAGDETSGDDTAGDEVAGDEVAGDAAAVDDGGDTEGRAQPAEVAVDVKKGAKPETVGGDAIEEVRRRRKPSNRRYKIQEVVARRQIMLVQVVKEERGNKGAALTTYLSLAGRYCVLMPNTARGGGVSRKITHAGDRKRLKQVVEGLDVPDGMAVIVRTAGSQRTKAEIKRDYEYLLRLWDEIRSTTLESTAPCLIYEEANLIKRSIRDLYARDIDEIQVDGDDGYRIAKDFMKTLIPSHAKRVKRYKDTHIPLLHRFQVESQLDAIHSPVVELKSGGYIVINQTEALVAIDVNSGRSTSERNIEETALKTNLEAADEVARQLRLRDLAGLVVIDFIDMEESRNQHAVERRMKEAMKSDRARIQIGRISHFGLMELSRQRLRPSLMETSTQVCPHCKGTGYIRSIDSTALHILRVIEEEGLRNRAAEIAVHVPAQVALYILNHKRDRLAEIEARYGTKVFLEQDDSLVPPDHRLERLRPKTADERAAFQSAIQSSAVLEDEVDEAVEDDEVEAELREDQEDRRGGRGRSRRRRRGGRRRAEERTADAQDQDSDGEVEEEDADDQRSERDDQDDEEGGDGRKRRRRGRRGGRRRSRRRRDGEDGTETSVEDGQSDEEAGEDGPVEEGDEVIESEAQNGEEVSVPEGEEQVPAAAAAVEGVETTVSEETAPQADEPEAPGTEAAEPAPEKPKRPRRRRKKDAEAPGQEASAEEAAVEAAAAEETVAAAAGAPAVEAPAAEAPTVEVDTSDVDSQPVEPGAEEVPVADVVAELESAGGTAADTISGEAGMDETSAGDGEQPEPQGATSVPIEVQTIDKPVEKPRKGWWRR